MKNLFALILISACAFAAQVHAQTIDAPARLTIAPPTKNTDGSNIPATGPLAIATYQVYLSRTAQRGAAPTATVAVASQVTVPFSAQFGDTVSVWVAACNGAGACSAVTNPVTYAVTAPTPNEPVIIEFVIQVGAASSP